MSRDQHVRSDHYALARSARTGRGALALQVHRHLVEVCAECGEAWRALGEGREPFRSLLLETRRGSSSLAPPEDPPPLHHQTAHSWEVRRLEEEVAEIRRVQGDACKSGWEILQLSPAARADRVRRAWTRFRSRAEAEYLLDKARACVREDPLESESLAATAASIVREIPGAAGSPWAAVLEARATAWRANALRVAGDLPAANRIFAALRLDLVTAPLEDAGIVGEVASLEASLRIDQRRLGEARELLELALVVAMATGDRDLELRVLVQQGNLSFTRGEPAEALHRFEQAGRALPAAGSGSPLLLALVNGRIASLCDLGRYAEAERLLDGHLDLYEQADPVFGGAILRHHLGRIAYGTGRFDEAVRCLEDAHRAFLEARRSYDAAVVVLDLAHVLADSGRSAELRSVARGLVPLFSARGVSRETLAALQLLVRAIQRDTVSAELVEQLRTRLRAEAVAGAAAGGSLA